MRKTLLQKTEQFIRQNHMIAFGDHIIAGVSGGADSICLLHVLLKLQEVFGHSVSVVHVEHGIRGEAAKMDAEFVRHFCAARGIECHICYCRVPAYAHAHGMSEEEAGRYLRYEAFRQEKKRFAGNVKIAVAHNLEDQAETMLFHLARGTGIRGLAGMEPVRGDIIRPLLNIRRSEIETYLMQLGQDFCTDATNGMDIYSRNELRHKALPVLHNINSQAAQHMYETAQQLRETCEYLKKQAADAQKRCCIMHADSVLIQKEPFFCTEPVIQKEMLYELLAMLAGSSKDITREHVRLTRELFDRQNGRQVQLPYGMTAIRVYGGIQIARAVHAEDAETAEENTADFLKKQFSFRIIEDISLLYVPDSVTVNTVGVSSKDISKQMSQISKKKYTKWFDYDKINNGCCIRSRLPGDYLVIDQFGSRQKLKKYLVNEKIPVKEREQLLLLADGAHIMWIVGYRISSYYKVNEHTRRILEVTFCGGKEDEGTDSDHDFRGRGKYTNRRDCGADQ